MVATVTTASSGAFAKVLAFAQQVLHEYVRGHTEGQGVDVRLPVRPHPLKVGPAELELTTLCALR